MAIRTQQTGGELVRVPPHNIDAERSVLGCCILERAALLAILGQHNLKPDDFFHPPHRYIYEAICYLFNQNIHPDYVSLTNYLITMGRLDDSGGPEYIAGLTNVVPSVRNAEHYARIVMEKSKLRQIMRFGTEISEKACEGRTELCSLLDWASKEFLGIMETRHGRQYASIESFAGDWIQQYQAFYHDKDIPGIQSGFVDLDRMLLGFQPGNLIVLAARPSQGKTALALDFARNIARDGTKKVAFISLEMSKEELLIRLICAAGLLDSYRLRRKLLLNKKDANGLNDWDRLKIAMSELGKMKIFIDDSSALTLTGLRAEVKAIALEQGLDVVIIDYLQLIDGELGAGDMRVQEVSKISRSLKALARELQVPVIALSQLSRHIERREGRKKVPQLSDLRESGSIEQDADVVLFIHREIDESAEEEGRQYDPNEVEDTQLIVAKNRNGRIGIVEMEFLRSFATFVLSDRKSRTFVNL